MDPLLTVIISAAAVTVLCEVILWEIFRRKIAPLSFPHELDTSYFRFFSTARLRLVAVVHTIFVGVCLAIMSFYLW